MEADRVATKREHLARLDSALALAKQRIQAERQREKDRRKAEKKKAAKAWALAGGLAHIVLIIYVLCGYRAEAAVHYLADLGRKRRWPAKEDEELEVMVENVFLAVNVDDLVALCDLRDPKDLGAAKVAVRVSEEWRLVQWVERLNFERGVAPSTEMVLARWAERREELPLMCRPPDLGVAAEARSRAWAMRWRRRWGGRHGRIRVREDLSIEEMRAKVEGQPEQRPCAVCWILQGVISGGPIQVLHWRRL